jgi:hypothetical protein
MNPSTFGPRFYMTYQAFPLAFVEKNPQNNVYPNGSWALHCTPTIYAIRT